MNLYSRIIVSIIAVISLGSCNNDEKIPALRGKVKFETIAVSGKLPGRIIEISVEEGQEVKKGDTLAFIDIPEVNAKIKQAEGAVTAARGQLDMAFNGATLEQLEQIKGQFNAGKAQLDFAKESFKRIEAMYQDSLVSRQQYDEVKMKLGMARAQVDALQAKQQEVEKGARTEQINQAQGQLDRALGSKDEVMSASMEQYLIAPKDMTIETVSLSEGELLTPGYPLFNGYEKNSMYFRFSIPESQVYDFKVGDVLTVVNPYTKEEISSRLVAVKQLAHYSDISSTAPMYQLSEPVYELKLVPESTAAANYFMNSTIILKH